MPALLSNAQRQAAGERRGRALAGAAVGVVPPTSIMCAAIARATRFIEAQVRKSRASLSASCYPHQSRSSTRELPSTRNAPVRQSQPRPRSLTALQRTYRRETPGVTMHNSSSPRLTQIRSQQPAAPIWQSEAVRVGPYIFTSAVLATDWKHGVAPEATVDQRFPYFGSEIERQTDYIMRSISRTLQAAGSGLHLVAKANVFILDCADFLGFDRVWNNYFRAPPTRTTVGSAGLLIPGARIEISVIALAEDSGLKVQPAVSNAPRPLAKKVEAMRAGEFVFTSGQLAHDAKNGVPPEAAGAGERPDLTKQSAYTIKNMTRSLRAAGASPQQVIKGQALLLDARQQSEFLVAWRHAFADRPALSV